MPESQFTLSSVSDRWSTVRRCLTAASALGPSLWSTPHSVSSLWTCLHLCAIPLTPQLGWQLQLYVPQEDSAQVLACLAGDPSHHLTSRADHHPLLRRQNASVSTLREETLQLDVWEVIFHPPIWWQEHENLCLKIVVAFCCDLSSKRLNRGFRLSETKEWNIYEKLCDFSFSHHCVQHSALIPELNVETSELRWSESLLGWRSGASNHFRTASAALNIFRHQICRVWKGWSNIYELKHEEKRNPKVWGNSQNLWEAIRGRRCQGGRRRVFFHRFH